MFALVLDLARDARALKDNPARRIRLPRSTRIEPHFLPAEQVAALAAEMRDAGLPEAVRTHDLRHTCASLLILLGAHPKAIQERLGHSDISVTLNLYGHLFPSLEEHLTDALDDLWRTATS